MPIELPYSLLSNWSSPSGGDAYLVPVYAGDIDAQTSRRRFVPTLPGELPIWGARRVQNLCTNFDLNSWFKSNSGVGSPPLFDVNAVPGPGGKRNATRVIFRLNRGTTNTDNSNFWFGLTNTLPRTRVMSVWMRSEDGAAYSVTLRPSSDGSPGAIKVVTVDGVWRRFSHTITDAVDLRVHLMVVASNAGNSGKDVVILHIATGDDYGPMLEDLTGTDQTAPSEYVCPTVDYGHGVAGVRWFTTRCGNGVNAGGVVVEAPGQPIPDVIGLRPMPAATLEGVNNKGAGAVVGVVGAGGAMPAGWSIAPGAGIVGTYSVASVGVDLELGLPFVDVRYQITVNSSSYLHTHFNAGAAITGIAPSQTVVAHAFMRLMAGALPPGGANLGFHWYASGAVYISETSNIQGAATPISSMAEFRNFLTPPASASTAGMRFSITNAPIGPYDFTIRFAGVGGYKGDYAFSPILGSSGQVSRLADSDKIGAYAFGGEWTVFAEVNVPEGGPKSQSLARQFIIGAPGGAKGLIILNDAGTITLWDGTSGLTAGPGSWSVGPHRIATRRKGGMFSVFVDGSRFGHWASSSLALGLATYSLSVGMLDSADMGNAGIRDVRVWPDRGLSDQYLQALTASGSTL